MADDDDMEIDQMGEDQMGGDGSDEEQRTKKKKKDKKEKKKDKKVRKEGESREERDERRKEKKEKKKRKRGEDDDDDYDRGRKKASRKKKGAFQLRDDDEVANRGEEDFNEFATADDHVEDIVSGAQRAAQAHGFEEGFKDTVREVIEDAKGADDDLGFDVTEFQKQQARGSSALLTVGAGRHKEAKRLERLLDKKKWDKSAVYPQPNGQEFYYEHIHSRWTLRNSPDPNAFRNWCSERGLDPAELTKYRETQEAKQQRRGVADDSGSEVDWSAPKANTTAWDSKIKQNLSRGAVGVESVQNAITNWEPPLISDDDFKEMVVKMADRWKKSNSSKGGFREGTFALLCRDGLGNRQPLQTEINQIQWAGARRD